MTDATIRTQIIAGTAPAGSKTGGALYLHGTGVTTLPEGLSVGGSLDLRGTGVTTLPEGLSVGGSIYLDHDVECAWKAGRLTWADRTWPTPAAAIMAALHLQGVAG